LAGRFVEIVVAVDDRWVAVWFTPWQRSVIPNLSLYFDDGVSYNHTNVTLMLVSCLHGLW